MRGRDVFMNSLLAHGVEHVFGNPGTTESPFLDALGDYPSIRYVTCLHEGIAVGAASYYARQAGRCPVVNLHVAPGLGNAIGMIYNALKAQAPMVVTAGQQDTRMLRRAPVLSHDLAAMAAPVCKWSTQVQNADEMDQVMRRAFRIACQEPAGPVFVALPIDVMEQSTDNLAQPPGAIRVRQRPDDDALGAAASLLAQADAPAIVVGDAVGRGGAMPALVALAERIGAPVFGEGIRGHVSFPAAHPQWRGGVAFDAAGIRAGLGDADAVLLVGGPFFEELWFAPGSPFPKGARVIQLETSEQTLGVNHSPDVGLVGDMALSLAALDAAVDDRLGAIEREQASLRVAELGEQARAAELARKARLEKAWNRSPIPMSRVMVELAAGTPENAILVEETITASLEFAAAFKPSRPDAYLGARGGGIGQGLAGAPGAAVAEPGRPVLCISGDGSAMYSIQALWTAAHLRQSIVFVILVNREYRVLKHNLDIYRQRFGLEAEASYPHMNLQEPALGFVELARGMGLSARHITVADDIEPALHDAFSAGGPHLIAIEIEGKR
ncbi:MAG: thiamine pyrophosphate-binding protein [Burkholderiaceae bacterium]